MPYIKRPTARLRILIFTADDCGVCRDLERSGFVAALRAKFRDVSIVKIDVEPAGEAARADLYEVDSLPTFVIELEHFGVVSTLVGAGTKRTTLKLLGAELKKARTAAKLLRSAGRLPW